MENVDSGISVYRKGEGHIGLCQCQGHSRWNMCVNRERLLPGEYKGKIIVNIEMFMQIIPQLQHWHPSAFKRNKQEMFVRHHVACWVTGGHRVNVKVRR